MSLALPLSASGSSAGPEPLSWLELLCCLLGDAASNWESPRGRPGRRGSQGYTSIVRLCTSGVMFKLCCLLLLLIQVGDALSSGDAVQG
jgi:hypothetical protein